MPAAMCTLSAVDEVPTRDAKQQTPLVLESVRRVRSYPTRITRDSLFLYR